MSFLSKSFLHVLSVSAALGDQGKGSFFICYLFKLVASLSSNLVSIHLEQCSSAAWTESTEFVAEMTKKAPGKKAVHRCVHSGVSIATN